MKPDYTMDIGKHACEWTPEHPDTGSDEPDTPTHIPAQGKTANTVLIVDDEDALCNLLQSALLRHDLHVIEAKNGLQGLQQLKRYGTQVSAIISDLHMPEMNGIHYARATRDILPDIPIAIVSGWIDDAHNEALKQLENIHQLNKPFTLSQLIQTLERMLPLSRLS